MSQRITAAKLQHLQAALSNLISAVHDARVRFPNSCKGLRPKRLSGLSKFVKDLLSLPHTSDYSFFEVQLKRRLVQAQHRVYGRNLGEGTRVYGLEQQLPVGYHNDIRAYGIAAQVLLRSLADVDITKNHQALKPVSEIPH